MRAVEFLFYNNDSTDEYFQQNLRYYMCVNCELEPECKKGENMPVISPLSRYMLKWHAESKYYPVYPIAGTWEDQPPFYFQLLDAISNKISKLEQNEIENGKQHK